MSYDEGHQRTISFVVSKLNVKRIKTSLEQSEVGSLLDKKRKIWRFAGSVEEQDEDEKAELYVIPTLIVAEECQLERSNTLELDNTRTRIVRDWPKLESCLRSVKKIIVSEPLSNFLPKSEQKANTHPNVIESSSTPLLPDLLAHARPATSKLVSISPPAHTIYPPMMLIPHASSRNAAWQELISKLSSSQRDSLYADICRMHKITHIASNAPIPAHLPTSASNFLRSPVNLTPLYGNFGPLVSGAPTQSDVDAAFWVSTKQNGISQTWAPRYTMFSRGNITEKARILHLLSVRAAVERGKSDGRGCAAVDLYAGIGYFAFSYVKAGVDRVLCWEINPWSLEGLARGAEANRWGCRRVEAEEDDAKSVLDSSARLLVFQESNENAVERVERLRERLPPVRHVNCGLLPSSKGSWETAVRVLDPEVGGWIHLHENIAVEDISKVGGEILHQIREIFTRTRRSAPAHGRPEHSVQVEDCAVLEHVERVKTYAPGVMHCVLDVRIAPRRRPNRE